MFANETLPRSIAFLLVLGFLLANGAAFAEASLLPDSVGKQSGIGVVPDVYNAVSAEDAVPSQTAVPQNYDGALWLDPPPAQVAPGSQVVFSGQLLTTAGHAVYDAKIYIKDDIDFGSDVVIATAVTDRDGNFSASWNAVQRSSGLYDFYAVSEGSSNVSQARSQTYSMAVLAYHTTITLDPLPSSVPVGEQVNFTGSLHISQGDVLTGATIFIQDEDTGSRDDILAQGITDSNGRFSIPWTAQQQETEIELEIRAVFEKSGPYLRSATDIQRVSVVAYHTVITLGDLPSSVPVGEQVIFTGTLHTLQGAALRGATIYIQDEDTGTGDDLLAYGTTDNNGRFSIPWTAEQQAPEIELEIRAVFEKSGPYLRSATDIQKVSVVAYHTVITLGDLPASVYAGNQVNFIGTLHTSQGIPLQGATIYIQDEDTASGDDILAQGTTDSSGRFSIPWTAQLQDVETELEIRAVFEESGPYLRSATATQKMSVLSYHTVLTLDALPSSVHVGDQINFTGSLHTSQGVALTGATIFIQDEDTASGDDILAQGTTDNNGRFSIPWTAQQQDAEIELEIRAVFEESGPYLRSATAIQKMSVVKYTGSLTLDTFPDGAKIGDVFIFSGTLTLENNSQGGAAIYIKDEDTLNPDDLLATAFAGADGRFSANWSVTDVDPDSVADIYAVFEGNDKYYRLTTCDDAPTDASGGTCNNTIPLRIGGFVTPPPVNPDPDNLPYMELYYAKNLAKDPHVVIVPSRDSFNVVRGHIIPAQEGIKMWTSLLESRNGGNWDVSFEVMEPGMLFPDSRPDIVMNLVTHETQKECLDQWAGAMYPNFAFPDKTVNTVVCSTLGGRTTPNAFVEAIAAHEFIHAMGLGHTFNKPGDLMCSTENDIPTCGNRGTKSIRPSVFNLEALEEIYRTDGYRLPNNSIMLKDRYYEDGRVVSPTAPLYAAVTGSNQITVTFAGPVSATPDSFGNLNLVYDGNTHARDIMTVHSGPGANDVTITFSGAPVPTSAIATLDIGNGTADGSGGIFADISDMVISDGQAPAAGHVTISSSGTGGVATVGDTIRLEFAFSEGTDAPIVTINGNNAVPARANGIWTASRTVDGADPIGAVTFSISGYADLAGNVGPSIVSTTDGSAVTVESVQPATPACIGEQTLNPLTNQCDDPVCAAGHELDPDTKTCEMVQQPTTPACIGQQTLNPLTNQCDDPVCGGDEVLNQNTKTCEMVQQPAVPTKAVVSGVIFSDTNWNGIRDAGEAGIGGYDRMLAIDISDPENIMEAVTAADGSYSFEVVPGSTVLVQTFFFPQGHVVKDPASSWFAHVVGPAAGDVINFDVGFHPVTDDELVEFEIRTFIDENHNRQRDPGERGVAGLGGTDPITFFTYTYTIGPTAYPLTGSDGTASVSMVPADFALFVDVAVLEDLGYYWTSTNYERFDDYTGKIYSPISPIVDDPEPGSRHVMDLGLWTR